MQPIHKVQLMICPLLLVSGGAANLVLSKCSHGQILNRNTYMSSSLVPRMSCCSNKDPGTLSIATFSFGNIVVLSFVCMIVSYIAWHQRLDVDWFIGWILKTAILMFGTEDCGIKSTIAPSGSTSIMGVCTHICSTAWPSWRPRRSPNQCGQSRCVLQRRTVYGSSVELCPSTWCTHGHIVTGWGSIWLFAIVKIRHWIG